MTAVANVKFIVTDHGGKVDHELYHQDNWDFTAQLTWPGNN